MKDPETLVGKFYIINRFSQSHCLYFFPGKHESRLRQDDMEMVYWTSYKVIGSTISEDIKEGKNTLVAGKNGSEYAKAMKRGNYTRVTKEKWQQRIIETSFKTKFLNFDFDLNEFFEMLDMMEK